MADCICKAASAKRFDCVERAVYESPEMETVLAGCETLVRDASRWMSVYRCRTCGMVWVEGYASSGPMEIQHLFPVEEAGREPEVWVREVGEPLPFEKWLGLRG